MEKVVSKGGELLMPKRLTKTEKLLQRKIGERLRKLREAIDKTQIDIAQELGVSQAAVSDWENGRNLPDAVRLYYVVRAYGINSIDALFDFSNDDISSQFTVITGELVRDSATYYCAECGDVRYLARGMKAPECNYCRKQTVWKKLLT